MSRASQLGGGAIKSIQRGVLSIAAYSGGPSTATATITAVATAKSELRLLGVHVPGGSTDGPNASIVLTNSTTITGTNGMSAAVVASWELTERY